MSFDSASKSELVVNTGPLIAFARGGVLDLIGQLPLVLICPQEVRDELDAGEGAGYVHVQPSWLQVEQLSGTLSLSLRANLDSGEAATIQLATERGTGIVCIDEHKGRQVAKAMGLEVTGSLGLLVRAKHEGLIDELRPVIERIRDAGHFYSDGLIKRVLEGVGE